MKAREYLSLSFFILKRMLLVASLWISKLTDSLFSLFLWVPSELVNVKEIRSERSNPPWLSSLLFQLTHYIFRIQKRIQWFYLFNSIVLLSPCRSRLPCTAIQSLCTHRLTSSHLFPLFCNHELVYVCRPCVLTWSDHLFRGVSPAARLLSEGSYSWVPELVLLARLSKQRTQYSVAQARTWLAAA